MAPQFLRNLYLGETGFFPRSPKQLEEVLVLTLIFPALQIAPAAFCIRVLLTL
jgi:hypothetical protein